jgi:lysyl-tRNA synthetase class 2
MKTRAGEVTIWASRVEMGSKCLVPPPEKWSGLQDKEIRYRRRYMDLWATPETMWAATMRSKLLGVIRRYLDARGDIEVETPVLQARAGGAAARPFVTHMNALDIDLFLRIAPELYHKRLLVGGMKGVYEISRNFRNEGMDRDHNPEFTCLEVYEAYGNYMTMLEMTEGLVRTCAWYVASGSERGWAALRDLAGEGAGELKLPFGDLMIDYGAAFERVTYAELFERGVGFPMTDVKRAHTEAEKRGLKVTSEQGVALDDAWVINELFEEVAEKTLDPAKPTFVMDYPSALSPLTRPKKDDPAVAERWDLFIAGMELGPAYTELNDPDIQAAKFREQLAGIDVEESTFRTFDEDFIQALKVGMPPAGGMGLGIDRLCMVLLDQPSIRDVILFPMMRPE